MTNANNTNTNSENGALPNAADIALLDAIKAHVEKFIGPIDRVFHDSSAEALRIDLLHVAPTAAKDYHTLITCGMSAEPMAVPEEYAGIAGANSYAELMLCLPPDWPLDGDRFKEEANYWPLGWLRHLATLPHEYEDWLALTHTIPNGDEADPFAKNTSLGCWMLLPPATAPEEFQELSFEGNIIGFYGVVALHRAEMESVLAGNTAELIEALNNARISEYLAVERASVVD